MSKRSYTSLLFEIKGNPHIDKEVLLKEYISPRYRISFPHTDDPVVIDTYKVQLLENLKVISSPSDCKRILDPKPKNLALFTNPNHKYIPLLMNYIETGIMKWSMAGDTLPVNITECTDLFKLVFYIVRLASIEAYQDIYQIKRFLRKL